MWDSISQNVTAKSADTEVLQLLSARWIWHNEWRSTKLCSDCRLIRSSQTVLKNAIVDIVFNKLLSVEEKANDDVVILGLGPPQFISALVLLAFEKSGASLPCFQFEAKVQGFLQKYVFPNAKRLHDGVILKGIHALSFTTLLAEIRPKIEHLFLEYAGCISKARMKRNQEKRMVLEEWISFLEDYKLLHDASISPENGSLVIDHLDDASSSSSSSSSSDEETEHAAENGDEDQRYRTLQSARSKSARVRGTLIAGNCHAGGKG